MHAASSYREQHVVTSGGVDRAWVRALDGLDRLFGEFSAPLVVDSVQPRRAAPPAGEQGNQLLCGFPPHVLLDHLNLCPGKPRIERGLAEPVTFRDDCSGRFLVDGLRGGRKPAVDDRFEQPPYRLVGRIDRDAGGETSVAAQHSARLAERRCQVRRELEAVSTHGGVEVPVPKCQPLDVHHLEPGVGNSGRAGHLDHSRRKVDSDDLATGGDLLREAPGEGRRPARQVEHTHARLHVDQLKNSQPAAGLAPRHHLLDALLVGQSVAAEYRRKKLFRFHGVRFCHSRSSHRAALSVSALVRPTTCMPTGRAPRGTGAGSATTGWPVVLNGRVNRASGSRTSSRAPTSGATIAVAGRSRASTFSIASSAAAMRRGWSRNACTRSVPRIARPRLRSASTSDPYFSGNCSTQWRWYVAACTRRMVRPMRNSWSLSTNSTSGTPDDTSRQAAAVGASRPATQPLGTASRGRSTRTTETGSSDICV